MTERRELLDIAVAAADAAGTIISERANDASSIPWQLKMHADFVTEVDTAAERAIRDTVFARIPDAHVLGEELSPDTAPSGITFVVDPLDGTTNFVHRYPVYAVSIAAAVDGIVEAAVILDVPHGDRYTAIRGGGAFRNGVPIAVSTIGDPTRALVGTGFPFKHLVHVDTYQRQFAAVVRTTSGIRRAGAAALDLVAVANGWFEAFWELTLAPWDIAAGVLLVREAGGVVTNLDGGDVSGLTHEGLVAGSPTMHEWLLNTIRTA